MSNLTPEVLEELTKALAAEEAAVAGKDDDEMYRTGSRLSNLLWTNAPALLAAAQRVQELEGVIRADEHRLNSAAVEVWGENVHGCDAPEWLADEILGLRAKVAELEGDRERMDWLDSQRRTLGGSQGAPTTETWPTIMGREGARVREIIDAARQAGTEEGA